MTPVAPKWLPTSPHRRPSRVTRILLGIQPIGLTARQRLRRWSNERDQEIIREAEALGISTDRPRRRQWWMERIKEVRRAAART